MSRVCSVGLTGGLASGKSTVAVLLARRGAEVLDADGLVHRLYQAGREGARVVAEEFGFEMLASDGSVERGRLAERILEDDEARERLNALIHPLVRQGVRDWLNELEQGSERVRVAVVEAALLVETGSYRDYDLLVVAWCRTEQQLERAVARGVDGDRARALLAAQAPLDAKREAADILIDNSGDAEDLPREVDRAWQEMLLLCGERS